MRANDTTFMRFIYQNQQLQIPIYQRKYSWEKRQCEQLFYDIVKIGKTENQTHFMGSIVYQSFADPLSRLTIIDGQQRITTLSLLLGALAKFLVNNPQHGKTIGIDSNAIVNKYLLNIAETGEDKYKLRLTDDDNYTYTKIIDSILSAEEFKFNDEHIKSRLYKTFDFFSNYITDENYEYVWKGIGDLSLVTINLENESPQAIFESLNSTGKGLDNTDLIRNFLLMDLKPEDQKNIYNSYWHDIESSFEDSKESFDAFIKYYLNVKYNNVIAGNTYEEFKKFRKQNFKTIKRLVLDVYKYWGYYLKIVFGREENKKLKKSFKSLNQLPYTIVRPFIMRLYEDYEEGKLEDDVFIEIINYTESYMLRRSICDRDSQSLKGFFAKMYSQLDKDNFLESYKYIIYSKSRKTSMPINEEFEKAFIYEDIYHQKNINKYILLKLTNFESTELTKIEECNIEHIMPQNTNLSPEWQEELGPNWEEIHAQYLHTIGNLTLTGSNSKLGDKPFMEKRTMKNGYDDSTINLNKYFINNNIEYWNEEEMNKRSEYLFEQAKKIWPYPEISNETKQKYDNNITEPNLDDYKPKEYINDNHRYWSECKRIIDKKYNFNPRKPNSRNNYILRIGIGNAYIQLTINSYTNEVKSQLYIKEKELYNYLYSQKNEIKSELNKKLYWENFDDRKSATISLVETFDLSDDWTWDESIIWQLNSAEILVNTFSNRIKKFNK